MHEDVKWLFGLILIFGVFWFVSTMTKNNNFTSSNKITQSSRNIVSPGFAHIGNNASNNQTSAAPKLSTLDEITQSVTNAGVQAAQIQKEVDALQKASQASPLAGELSIVGTSRGSGSPANEYIIVRASPQNTAKVLITGLRFQSVASGRGANIPGGVALFFQNQVNTEQSVYLSPGDTAYIISGRSPLGASFRPNKCTGFLNQYQTFNPSLPNRCPRPNERDLPSNGTIYNDACRNYINSLPACRVIISPPVSISPECQRYVTTEINYTKCVDAHKNDSDFYDPSWRIYLGRDDSLWKTSRELIHFVDQNGKIIDAITY